MTRMEPGSEEWSRLIQQALTEAAENAVAQHIRDGDGDKIRAMQDMAARYYASHTSA